MQQRRLSILIFTLLLPWPLIALAHHLQLIASWREVTAAVLAAAAAGSMRHAPHNNKHVNEPGHRCSKSQQFLSSTARAQPAFYESGIKQIDAKKAEHMGTVRQLKKGAVESHERAAGNHMRHTRPRSARQLGHTSSCTSSTGYS